MPDVSLVIVAYNSRAFIGLCLDAVRRQEGVSFETIVVDNGSQDGTADFVRQAYPEVRVVEQANLGFGAGNNRGAREARGEVLAFVNPDATPSPAFLAGLRDATRRGQAATAQVVVRQDPRMLNTAGHRLHFTGYGFVIGYGHPPLPPGPPVETQGISGAGFAIHREDYEELGGFDEDFFLYMEDTELSWRMHRAGLRIVVAPAARTMHDYVPGFGSRKIAHLETGRLLLLRKHLPRRLWVAYLPSLALAELLAWGRAAWLGRAGLAAKWEGLRRGWRRGIRRYPHLPPARPHRFCSREMPFRILTSRRLAWAAGAAVNLLFRANTLAWRCRRERAPPGPVDDLHQGPLLPG